MFNNILELLKFQIINNIFSINIKDLYHFFLGDPVTNSIIILILSIILYFINDFSFIINFFKKIYIKNIILEGKRHFNSSKHITRYEEFYSIRFRAIWYYINKNISNLKISSLKEYTNSSSNYNEYGDKVNCNDFSNDHSYIINQKEKFEICENINCKISVFENNFESSDKNKNIIEDTIIIELFTYKKDIKLLDNFINKCIKEYRIDQNSLRSEKLFIYSLNLKEYENSYNCDKLGYIWEESEFISNKTFSNIFFKNKQEILKKITNFIENQEQYYKFGIPYHLGILIYGPPGTGKTSFIKALTNLLKRHLIMIHINKIKTNQNLSEIFNESTYNKFNKENSIGWKDKILLFEDIDCNIDIIKKRDNTLLESFDSDSDSNDEKSKEKKSFVKVKNLIKNPDKITLGHILNLLDGVKETPGRIIIVTSNHKEKIDPAFIRPGRIDLCLEFDYIDHQILTEMFNFYYNEQIDDISKLIDINLDNISSAQITNIVKNSITKEEFCKNIIKLNY